MTIEQQLISIKEAVARGIERVRKPIWKSQFDHLKIDIVDGKPGPWLHLWCPFNTECNGRDPVDELSYRHDMSERCFLPYTGPLPDSDEYKAEVAQYAGCISGRK